MADDTSGLPLLIGVWVVALLGVALKVLWPTAPSWVGIPLYLGLGWAIVPLIGPLVHGAVGTTVGLLFVGAVVYSVAAIFYATKWPNPWPSTFGHHEFFHAATAIAAICHYAAVWIIVGR